MPHKEPTCLFTNSHIFDEHGLCVECDYQKPKSRAADMKRSRDKRKESGLVEFRCWIHPDDKHLLDSLAQDLSRARSIVTANRLYGAVVDDLQSG